MRRTTTRASLRPRLLRASLLVAAAPLLVAAPMFSGGAPSAWAAEEVPLPLTGRQTVKASGKVYVIDGKQTIPPGSVIRVEANVQIVGKHGASLDVQGGLRVHGIPGSRVQITGVDLSPTLAPDNEVHLDECDLSQCLWNTAAESAITGNVTIENADWSGGLFRPRIQSGFLRLMSLKLNVDATVTALPNKGRPPEVAIRDCTTSAVTLVGAMTATVRDSELRAAFEAREFTDLVFDANDVKAGAAFRQPAEGSFSRLVVTKLNLLDGAKLVFHRPATETTTLEKVRLDKLYFGRADGSADMTDKQIADRIDDATDDPKLSVKAYWQNPQEKRH